MEKKRDQDIKQEVEQRLREIAMLKQEAQEQGLAFSSLSEDDLVKKVRAESSGSPYIYSMSWTSGTTPGSSALYTVNIANPDAISYYPMFVTIFFGLANFFDDISQGWIGRDIRWPELSTAPFSLAAGATTNKTFSYTTPTGVPLSTYLGTAVVWVGSRFDQGSYFDRGLFQVTLS